MENQLRELRDRIVQKTQQLAVSGNGSPAERFQVLMGIIQSGDADLEVLNAAFELTSALESDNEQLTALLEVLYEVDARIAALQPDNQSGDTLAEQSENNEGEQSYQ